MVMIHVAPKVLEILMLLVMSVLNVIKVHQLVVRCSSVEIVVGNDLTTENSVSILDVSEGIVLVVVVLCRRVIVVHSFGVLVRDIVYVVNGSLVVMSASHCEVVFNLKNYKFCVKFSF